RADRGELSPVEAERHTSTPLALVHEEALFLAGQGVPDLHGPGRRGRGQPGPFRVERHAGPSPVERHIVAHTWSYRERPGCRVTTIRSEIEAAAFRSGRRAPELDGPVIAGRGQPGPIGAERQAVHPTGVTPEDADFQAGRRVPEPHRPVQGGRGDPGPVGAEGYALDLAPAHPHALLPAPGPVPPP